MKQVTKLEKFEHVLTVICDISIVVLFISLLTGLILCLFANTFEICIEIATGFFIMALVMYFVFMITGTIVRCLPPIRSKK